MIKRITDFTLILFCVTLCWQPLRAQSIWPGDLTNNGVVSASDVLYLGYAFGAEGFERSGGSSWEAKPMGTPWLSSFPSGLNMAYADTDGDGKVDRRDFEVLSSHLGRSHLAVEQDLLHAPDTTAGIPVLWMEAEGIRMRGDKKFLQLQFFLAKQQGVVENFYGLAFEIRYNGHRLLPGNVKPLVDTTNWVMGSGEELFGVGRVDSLARQVQIGISRINHEGRSGRGRILRVLLPVTDDFMLEHIVGLDLRIERLVMVNKGLEQLPITTRAFAINLTGCPLTVSPVCGIDGVTYLNSCFAEAAGVDFYTSGACFSPAITVANMDSAAVCPTVYAPVCGFNYQTYANACEAENAGLSSYTAGSCVANDFSCYDPNLIVISNATTVNTITGVIELNCPSGGEAVLGCDGITYPNICTAEASGVRSYTVIGSQQDCIDYTQIDEDAACANTIDYVCGCNGYTFVNACYAEAAGLTSYTAGPCGGTSSICAEAVAIDCGDFLPNETSIGAGNQIVAYSGFTSVQMLGPDRVYVFQKTTVGDIQIGLEIITPGLDMDLFLLRGDCNNLVCIAASTTPNTVTNNEGILVRDAPLGTYYIIVDQQMPGAGGNYHLELSCGYLDCTDVVSLQCGQVYQGSNANGNDDVSLYSCGNVLNVENNGPEILHSFTVTQAGNVAIDLTGLAANLELFLLSSCDRGACMAYSQNPGTSSEQIIHYLQPGTYYVAVDGYNGAISTYNLTVSCLQGCNLTYVPTGTSNANCGQNNGEHNFSIYGGVGTHIATYQGPVSGTQVSQTGHFCFVHLVPGTYTTTIQDGSGCTITRQFVIGSNGNLSVQASSQAASCGSQGAIQLSIAGSSPPYTIYLSGQATATLQANSNHFTISNLVPGTYNITVVSAGQCTAATAATVQQASGNLSFVASPVPAACGQLGRIGVVVQNGYLNYIVRLQGPVSGTAVVEGHNFHINDLPAGVYSLRVTDAYGCTSLQTVVVPSTALEVQVSTTAASCGNQGSAQVFVNNGTAPYTVNYFGPTTGTVTSNSNLVQIPNLGSGSYSFSVWDAGGCDITRTAYVNDLGSNLTLNLSQGATQCGANAAPVFVQVNGGTPSYSLYYAGPVSGSTNLSTSGQTLLQLPAGNYTFTVNDFAGCSTVRTLTVLPTQNNLSAVVMATANSCGQATSLQTNISGGSSPYQISVTNSCGLPGQSFQVFNNQFMLENLSNCTYFIAITDANGCSVNRSVNIEVSGETDLLTLQPVGGVCGGLGYIDVFVSGGSYPYFISWTGPMNGSVNLASNMHRVQNLVAGEYTFQINTADGCSQTLSTTLVNVGDLALISSLVTLNCGQYDQIWNDILGGTAPYTVEVTRLCDGMEQTFLVQNNGFELFDLIPCEYKIKVTDANGCMTMNTTTVFPYQLFDALPSPGLCGQTGSIQINITNPISMPPYTVQFTGPVSGSLQLNALASTTLFNLTAGTYTIVITDAGGCTETETVVLVDTPSDLDLVTATIFDNCGVYNQLWNDIIGGTAPYTVEVIRLCDGTVDTTFITSATEFELENLPACEYKVIVTDANGCMDMEIRTIDPAPANIFTAVAINGLCAQLGRMNINFTSGTAPYQLTYSGPLSGSTTVNGTAFSLLDLPAGVYTLTAVDANGCSQTTSLPVIVTPSDLDLVTATIFDNCGVYNQLWNDIIGGTAPYTVEVIRLCDGTVDTTFITSATEFELENLPACEYKVIVTDANGCMDMEIRTIDPAPANIFTATPINGLCGALGTIQINFTGGTAPYQFTYAGPLSGSTTVNGSTFSLLALPAGVYTLTAVDANGCSQTTSVTIQLTASDLDLVASLILNDCGQYNQVWSDINGGTGPYTVLVIRLCDSAHYANFVVVDPIFELFDLPPCDYKITVTDANGCMDMDTVTVFPSPINLFTVQAINGACNELGSITVQPIAGTIPYELQLTGPVAATVSLADGAAYTISNLPNGTYTIILRDANNCYQTQQVTIVNTSTDLELITATIFNDCGQYNQLWNDIVGGVGPYTVEVSRLCDNTIDTVFVVTGLEFELYNLPPCTYKVKITDAQGCMAMTTSSIYSTNADLVDIVQSTSCDNPKITFIFTQGNAPFQITLMGPNGEITYPNITSTEWVVNQPANGDYMVVITSAEGCVEFDFFSFQAQNGVPPTAAFTAMQTGTTVYSFTNASSSGAYSWDFGNGDTSTEENPSINFGGTGVYNVCLTVTNGCGSATYCEEISITSGSIMLDMGEVSGATGQQVLVPVTLQGSSNLAALSGSLQLSPAGSATIVGVSPALIAPSFHQATATFSYQATSGQGLALNPEVPTVLFYLRVNIIATTGQIMLTFTHNPMAVEVAAIFPGGPNLLSAEMGSGQINVSTGTTTAGQVDIDGSLNDGPIDSGSVLGGNLTTGTNAANERATVVSAPSATAASQHQTAAGVSTTNTSRAATEMDRLAVEQNQPNPFTQQTKIRFYLPAADVLHLRLLDALGRPVYEQRGAYAAGEGYLLLDLGHLPAGLYYYQVSSSTQQAATRAMLIGR